MADDLAARYAAKYAGTPRENTGASGGFATAAVTGKPIPKKTEIIKPGGLPGLLQKTIDVGSQIGNVGAMVAGKALGFVGNTAVDIAKAGINSGRTYVEAQTQPIQNKINSDLTKRLELKQQEVQQAYKSGKMSKDDYLKTTQELGKAFSELSKETQKISAGPTPQQRAMDVAETAVNALTLGSFTTRKALGKEVTKGLTSRLENAVTKVPAIKALAERNARSIIKAGANETFDQALATNAKNIAIGLLIKRPIFYQTNIEGGKGVYDQILSGNYGGAAKSSAWLATQMLEGGPIGAFIKGGNWLKKKAGELSYGHGSFIDEISKQIGDGDQNQIASYLRQLEGKKGNFGVAKETPGVEAFNAELKGRFGGDLTKALPEGVTPDDVLSTRVYGSSISKAGKPAGSDVDVAIKLPKDHPFIKAHLEFNPGIAKVGNIHYTIYADTPNGIKQAGNFINKAKGGALRPSVETSTAENFKDATKTLRILQETNLQAANDDVNQAVENVLTHYRQHNIDLKTLTPAQLVDDMAKWAKADEAAQSALKSGLVKDVNPEDAAKYVVVRWDTPTKTAVADAISSAGPGAVPQMQALEELASRPGVGWGNNEILMSKLRNIVANSRTTEEAVAAIKDISTASTLLAGVPKKIADQLSDLGYSIAAPFGGRKTPIVDQDNLRKLITGAVKGESDIFDVARAPDPSLAALAGGLDKAGLSPRSINQVANRKLQESVVANLDELGLGKELGLKTEQGGDVINAGKVILSKLQTYVENKKPAFGLGKKAAITDIRQMTMNEISDALGVTKNQAKTISDAVMTGYLEVPLEFRGLGDKVVDALYKYNPLQKYYSRIQSAFRYTYNPFFRTQERVETALLSRAQANNLVWGKGRGALDDAARKLDNAGIFTSSLPGEAAQDQVLGRITANITQGQKRDLAGLALDMAKSKGLSLDEMVAQHSDELDDALRVVVQYPSKGILSSPLARTLNVAFFPMRYNTKVTMLAAQTLAKQPPSVQLAFLHSMFNMKDWLKSDEGIKWQSEHADAIQVLKWLTPINSIESTMNLLGHKPDSMGSIGQLGGATSWGN